MNTDYFKKLSELPDFRLRVSACNSKWHSTREPILFAPGWV
jgi:hypothetical protein